MGLSQESFAQLPLARKYELLRASSDFVASRTFGSFHVHLFQIEGFYVEMWMKLGINVLNSIDVVRSQDTLDAYLDNIKLKL